jgi:hypothetical protein
VRTRQFVYPLWFRFLYLWATYVIIPAGIASVAWLGFPTRHLVWYTALLLAAGYLWEKLLFRRIPVRFVVEEDRISAYRIRRVLTFRLSDVERVDLGVQPPLALGHGDWTSVRCRVAGAHHQFYISSRLPGCSDLVRMLADAAGGTIDSHVSEFHIRMREVFRLWGTLLWFAVVFFAVSFVPPTQNWPVWTWFIWWGVLLILATLFVRQYRTLPLAVIFEPGKIVLRFTIWPSIELGKSDIAAVVDMPRFFGMKSPDAGCIIRLRDGRKFYVVNGFVRYPELEARLRRIVRHT